MNRRTVVGIWKANLPQWVWACLPLWIGSVVFALDGGAPEWGSLVLLMATVVAIQATSEYANTYVDRDVDSVFVPSNPLVTGELGVRTARRALILENVIAGLLVVALLLVTLNYYLVVAVVAAWFLGLAYSLQPLKLKETIAGPFCFAVTAALVPIVAGLFVGQPSDLLIAFALFIFLASFGANISTGKLRKTIEALKHGQIRLEQGSSVYHVGTVGLNVSVKTAVALEAFAGFAAFALVPVFWHLDIFSVALSVSLLTLPLAFTILTVVLRLRRPVRNYRKCLELTGLSALFAVLAFFSLALIDVLHWHWGFAVLACIVFLVVFGLLFRQVHPFGPAPRFPQVQPSGF